MAIYARGAIAHLFLGVHEQNYIAHVMAFASCVGDYADLNDCALATSGSKGLTPLAGRSWWILWQVLILALSLSRSGCMLCG